VLAPLELALVFGQKYLQVFQEELHPMGLLARHQVVVAEVMSRNLEAAVMEAGFQPQVLAAAVGTDLLGLQVVQLVLVPR
jgi:hypothetical protein